MLKQILMAIIILTLLGSVVSAQAIVGAAGYEKAQKDIIKAKVQKQYNIDVKDSIIMPTSWNLNKNVVVIRLEKQDGKYAYLFMSKARYDKAVGK